MPFVFAVWVARSGVNLRDLPARLEAARNSGLGPLRARLYVTCHSARWPADLALQYLTGYLKYEINEKQLAAITHFHQLAAEHGLIASPPRPLKIYR